jgi:hypothetical protein
MAADECRILSRSTTMQVPFKSREEFENKARQLAAALGLEREAGIALMAQIAGYADASRIGAETVDARHRLSREELMARLQAEHPEVDNASAGGIIDSLGLPMRDTDMEHIPDSPGAAPNMGG